MTDPNKLTLLMPGFDRVSGAYESHGVPAPLLAEYLRENRIVAEKNDLHSLLFLLTPGVESSKAGTLLSWIVTFKRLHDENALLQDVIPDFVRARPQRYRDLGLRDLSAEMHGFHRNADISRLQQQQFRPEHFPVQAMLPHEAARMLVRNKVDYLPIDRIQGRIAATLMLVYPPGIATVVPGERLGDRAAPMIDYLLAFERAENLFPGLGTEIQGVYREIEADGRIRFHTYVVRD
jgi:arginine/lysine/ornithine decarboxylase